MTARSSSCHRKHGGGGRVATCPLPCRAVPLAVPARRGLTIPVWRAAVPHAGDIDEAYLARLEMQGRGANRQRAGQKTSLLSNGASSADIFIGSPPREPAPV